MKIRKRIDEKGGFTLIEVLLALSLSAVIASALYQLLWTGAGAWKRMRERAELYQTARVVFERLQTDLQNQVVLSGGALQDLAPFEGTQTHLAFPAALWIADSAQPSGQRRTIAHVSYSWKNAEAGKPAQLVREWSAFLPNPSATVTSQANEAFPEDVAGISFAYPLRQSAPAAPPVVWEDHWDQTPRPPEGLRIDLVLKQPQSGQELTLRKIVQIWQGAVRLKPES